MQIRMEELTIEGLGPYMEAVCFDFRGKKRAFIYAENDNGKTSTLDIILWLLRGQAAAIDEDFSALVPDAILNYDYQRANKPGFVEAVFNVGGDNDYRVRRTMRNAHDIPGQLQVARLDDKSDDGILEDSPHEWLNRTFPSARVGFNLLTGEHISKFVDNLGRRDYRKEIENLLQFPEMARAKQTLHKISANIQQEVQKNRQKLKRQADAEKSFEKFKEDFERFSKAAETEEAKAQELEKRRNNRLVSSHNLASNDETRKRIAELHDKKVKHQVKSERAKVDFQAILDTTWRAVLCNASRGHIEEELERWKRHNQRQDEYLERRAHRKLIEHLAQHDQDCVCGRKITKDIRDYLNNQIHESGQAPTPPRTQFKPEQLESWKERGNLSKLLASLADLQTRAVEEEDLAMDTDARISEVQSAFDQEAADLLDTMQAENEEDGKEATEARTRASEFRDKAANAKRDMDRARRNKDAAVDTIEGSSLSNLASEYAHLFAEVIEEAKPWYNRRLEEAIGKHYHVLSRRHREAAIRLDRDSCMPRVLTKDGEVRLELGMMPGQGEQLRLGLSFLFGLRDVANERPFLALDAPFSNLDEPGKQALLQTLCNMDTQVIIFSKDIFHPDHEPSIERLDPKVYRMTWMTDEGGTTDGFPRVAPASKDVLLSVDAERWLDDLEAAP